MTYNVIGKPGIPRGHDTGTFVLAEFESKYNTWSSMIDVSRIPHKVKNPSQISLPYLLTIFFLKAGLELGPALKTLYFVMVLLSLLSSFTLVKFITNSNAASLLSSIIYTINPVNPFYGGFNAGISYAFFPLVLVGILHLYDRPSFINSIKLSLLLSIFFISSPLSFIVSYGFFLFCFIILYKLINKKFSSQFVKHLGLSLLFSSITSSYYIYHTFIFYTSINGIQRYDTAILRLTDYLNALLQLPPVGYHFYNLLLKPILFVIPITAMLTLLFIKNMTKKEKRLSLVFATLMVVFINLSTNNKFNFLFLDVFQFLRIARMANRFMVVEILSFSVLIGIFYSIILRNSEGKRIRLLITTFSILFYIISVSLASSGWYESYSLPKQYMSQFLFIKRLDDNCSVMYIPVIEDKFYTNFSIWSINFGRTFGPSIGEKPSLGKFRAGYVNVNENLRSFLSSFLESDADTVNPNYARFFSILNIKYYVLLPNAKESYEKTIKSQRQLDCLSESICVYDSLNCSTVSSVDSIAVISGNSKEIIENLVHIDNFNPDKIPIVDIHDLDGFLKKDDGLLTEKIRYFITTSGTQVDKKIIRHLTNLKWVIFFNIRNLSIREPVLGTYELRSNLEINKEGEYSVAFLTTLTKEDVISLKINNKKIKIEINKAYSYYNAFSKKRISLYWVFSEKTHLKEGENKVSLFVRISDSQPKKYFKCFLIYSSNENIRSPKDIFKGYKHTQVKYRKISPTKYEIFPQNSSVILLKENYNKYWNTHPNEENFIVRANFFNSLIIVSNDKKIEISYSPQEIFSSLLITSAFFSCFLILILSFSISKSFRGGGRRHG